MRMAIRRNWPLKKQINNSEMEARLRRCRRLVEEQLNGYFVCDTPYKRLLESMRYSLLAGGKRVRAVMCIEFCEAAGGTAENALAAACAIEMLHTYSLIHDDLPCMDDDDTRRGKPSNHIEFGESTATLAGDALQAAAFDTLLSSGAPSGAVVEMGRILAGAAGPYGICGGQYLDLHNEEKMLTIAGLEETHGLKTAALMSASAKLGVVAAGGTQEQLMAAEEYAAAVGLAFQIRDDLLDHTSSAAEIGKPAGSDISNGKTTFATLFGAGECETKIREKTEVAVAAIDGVFDNTDFLVWFARMLADRRS